MKKIKILSQIAFLCLSGLFLGSPVLAQGKNLVNLSPTGNFSPLVSLTVPNIVPVVIRVVLIVAALIALVFLIIGGIKWITSGGDKAQVESARGTITSALIGLVVVFAAWAIIRLIELFFGIQILSLEIPAISKIPYP